MNPTKAYRERSDFNEQHDLSPSIGKTANETVIHWYLYIKKWKAIFLLFLLIGLAFGIIQFRAFKPVYNTYLLATSQYLSNEQVQNIIESLQEHINNGDYEVVAERLNMTPEQTSEIISLRCQFANRNSDKKMFRMNMDIASNDQYALYQQKIFDYMERLPYVRKKVRLEKELTENILGNVKEMYFKLDNMENLINSSIQIINEEADTEGKKIVSESMVRLASIVEQKLGLKKRQFELESQLLNNSNFEIVRGFEKFNKPTEMSVFSIFLAPVLLALLFAAGLTWLLELRAEVKRRTRLRVK